MTSLPKRPYDILHIYELTGLPGPLEPDPKLGFLGCWYEDDSAFLFFSRPAPEQAARLAGELPIRDAYELSYDDWQGRPESEVLTIGRLVVHPPWVAVEPDPGRVELLLDPGVVFGAGNHPTTRHCLAALLALEARQSLTGRFLDLGCGTGILSLAALALGAESALAVDLNPLCSHVSRVNATLNGLEKGLEIQTGDALQLARHPAEILAANLQADLLYRLIDLEALTDRKRVILSGITRSHAEAIAQRVINSGFEVEASWTAQSTWFTFLFRAAKVKQD